MQIESIKRVEPDRDAASPFDFSTSISALGRNFTAELCEALVKGPIRQCEVHPDQLKDAGESGMRQHARLRKLVAEGGLAVSSLHLPYWDEWDISNLDEGVRRGAVNGQIELARPYLDLKPRLLTLHSGAEPVTAAERPYRMEQSVKSIRALSAFAAANGMAVALEFLPRSCLGNHEDELLELAAPYKVDEVGVCLDVNHVMARAAELPQIIGRLAPRLLSAHISDYDGIDECHWLPGRGVIDWPAVVQALCRVPRRLTLIYETTSRVENVGALQFLRAIEECHEQVLGRLARECQLCNGKS